MKKVVLSKRLQAVANMVTPGNRVCDVGCDHGFVAIYLIEQGISRQVLAMDVNPGPLARAAAHIGAGGLSGHSDSATYIKTRQSDGISQLRIGEADTVILAGMGGRLMQSILSVEKDKTESLNELILQPQSEIPAFRRFIRTSGYQVVAEEMVFEEEKFYSVMKVIPVPGGIESKQEIQEHRETDKGWSGDRKPERTESPSSDRITPEDRWGKLLLAGRHPVLKQYLNRELAAKEQIMDRLAGNQSARKQKRMFELQTEIEEIKQILTQWEEEKT